MECALGRALRQDEIVHHKDGNKLNNSIDNLVVMTRSEHAHEHEGATTVGYCMDCGKQLVDNRARRCVECSHKAMRVVKDRPSKDILQQMVDETSYTAVGRVFGVSDNTIRKWLR